MTNEQIEELMREICSTPLLTPEEESELLEKIQAKDADSEEMRVPDIIKPLFKKSKLKRA